MAKVGFEYRLQSLSMELNSFPGADLTWLQGPTLFPSRTLLASGWSLSCSSMFSGVQSWQQSGRRPKQWAHLLRNGPGSCGTFVRSLQCWQPLLWGLMSAAVLKSCAVQFKTSDRAGLPVLVKGNRTRSLNAAGFLLWFKNWIWMSFSKGSSPKGWVAAALLGYTYLPTGIRTWKAYIPRDIGSIRLLGKYKFF